MTPRASSERFEPVRNAFKPVQNAFQKFWSELALGVHGLALRASSERFFFCPDVMPLGSPKSCPSYLFHGFRENLRASSERCSELALGKCSELALSGRAGLLLFPARPAADADSIALQENLKLIRE